MCLESVCLGVHVACKRQADDPRFQVAADPESSSAGAATGPCIEDLGLCSAACPRCESGLGQVSRPFQICRASQTADESACTGAGGIWSGNACYKPAVQLSSKVACPPNYDPVGCESLDQSTCGAGQLPIKCAWNAFAACANKTACGGSGQCNDFAYWTETTAPVCRIPWSALAYAPSACNTTLGASALALVNDACILNTTSNETCLSHGGALVKRALSKDACVSQQVCSFNSRQATGISSDTCQFSCSALEYDWMSVYSWSSGTWSAASSVNWTTGVKASSQALSEQAALDLVNRSVVSSVVSIFSQAFSTQANCKAEPLIEIFASIACMNSIQTGATEQINGLDCSQRLQKPSSPKLASLKAVSGLGFLWQSTVGSVSLSFPAGAPALPEHAENISVSLLGKYEVVKDAVAASSGDCSAYANVMGSDGSTVVGQVVGSGLVLDGVTRGTLRVCLNTDPTIPVCLDRYPVADFAELQGGNLVPLSLATTVDTNSQQLCAAVNATALGSISLVPIRRTQNSAAYVGYSGWNATLVLLVALPSKTLLTDARQACLRAAVAYASVYQNESLISTAGTVIPSVCDTALCNPAAAQPYGVQATVMVRMH